MNLFPFLFILSFFALPIPLEFIMIADLSNLLSTLPEETTLEILENLLLGLEVQCDAILEGVDRCTTQYDALWWGKYTDGIEAITQLIQTYGAQHGTH